jgi:hypothetical protein
MDVYSTELVIWLSFVKTSEFWGGGGGWTPKPSPLGTPLQYTCTHQQHKEQHNDTEYPKWNIYKNKSNNKNNDDGGKH